MDLLVLVLLVLVVLAIFGGVLWTPWLWILVLVLLVAAFMRFRV